MGNGQMPDIEGSDSGSGSDEEMVGGLGAGNGQLPGLDDLLSDYKMKEAADETPNTKG